MTKGDKIKLRAELAGKAMQGLLAESGSWAGDPNYCAQVARIHADALMAELGVSMVDEWDKGIMKVKLREYEN